MFYANAARGLRRFSGAAYVMCRPALAACVVVVIGSAAALTPAAGAHSRHHRRHAARQTSAGCGYAQTPIAAAPRVDLQRAVVCLINRQRSKYHLPRLHENALLD